MDFRQALTFDDVLLVPAASAVLPTETDTRTRLTRAVSLGIPLISAAMDTVTESALAIAMAQAGGPRRVHPHHPIQRHARADRQGKKVEAPTAVKPLTLPPAATTAAARP